MPEAMANLPVRTRGLPEGHSGLVRLVEIDDLDLNTCGGTHLRSTAELETIALVGTEPMRGGTRVHFVFGGRVRSRLAAHEQRGALLRDLLGAPDADLPAVAELKLEQLKQAQREGRRLREQLAELLAGGLTASMDPVATCHLDAGQVDLLRPLASRLAGGCGPAAFLLAADDGTFAVALGESCTIEVTELGQLVAKILEGKGGGRNRLFQGKADHPELLEAAAAAVRDALRN
jgi:alanyl-tRNA synthetase